MYLVWDNYFRKKDDGGEAPKTSETIERTEDKKEETKENNATAEESGEDEDEKKVKQYDGEDPNKAEELSGVVTYAGVLNNKLTIRVNIDQYLGEGKCELNLTKDGNTVRAETSGIVSAATTATCEGFDVPVNGLEAGEYNIIVKLDAGGKVGTINGKVKI